MSWMVFVSPPQLKLMKALQLESFPVTDATLFGSASKQSHIVPCFAPQIAGAGSKYSEMRKI